MAVDVGTLVARIGADTKGLEQGLGKAQGLIAGFKKNVAGIVAPIGEIAAAAAQLGAGFTLGELLRRTIQEGAQFELAMRRVKEITEATATEFKNLGAAARSAAEQTEFSATDAAKAEYILAQAGMSAVETMKLLKPTLDFATAAMLDVEDATRFATTTLKAFELRVEEFERVGDVLFEVAATSVLEVKDLAESFKYAAGLAAELGYTVEETAGILGFLADRTLRGSIGGTNLARAMQIAAQQSYEMGLASSDLLDVLDALEKRGATVTDLMKLFGRVGGRAALALIGRTDEMRRRIEDLGEATGRMAQVARGVRETTVMEFGRLRAQITVIMAEAFEGVAAKMAAMLRGAREWLRENKAIFRDFLSGALDLLAGIGRVAGAIIAVFVKAASDLNALFLQPMLRDFRLLVTEMAFGVRLPAIEGIDRARNQLSEFQAEIDQSNDELAKLQEEMEEVYEAAFRAAEAANAIERATGKSTTESEVLRAAAEKSAARYRELAQKAAELSAETSEARREAEGLRAEIARMPGFVDLVTEAIRKSAAVMRLVFLPLMAMLSQDWKTVALIGKDAFKDLVDANKTEAQRLGDAIDKAISGALDRGIEKAETWRLFVEDVKRIAEKFAASPLVGFRSKAAKEAGRAVRTEKPVVPPVFTAEERRELERALGTVARMYSALIRETGITTARMKALWADYVVVRTQQAHQEALEIISNLQLVRLLTEKTTVELAAAYEQFATREAMRFLIQAQLEPVEQVLAAYEELAQQQGLTASQITAIWEKQKEKRLEQIELLHKAESEAFGKALADALKAARLTADEEELRQKLLRPIEANIAALQELLREQGLTAQQIIDIWDRYTVQRIRQLDLLQDREEKEIGARLAAEARAARERGDRMAQTQRMLESIRPTVDALDEIIYGARRRAPGTAEDVDAIAEAYERWRKQMIALEAELKTLQGVPRDLAEEWARVRIDQDIRARFAGVALERVRAEAEARREIMEGERLTLTERLRRWRDYERAQRDVIERMRDKMIADGQLSADTIEASHRRMIEALRDEYDQFARDNGLLTLPTVAKDVANGMAAAFEDLFIKFVEGEVITLRDFLDILLRDIERRFAETLSKILVEDLPAAIFKAMKRQQTGEAIGGAFGGILGQRPAPLPGTGGWPVPGQPDILGQWPAPMPMPMPMPREQEEDARGFWGTIWDGIRQVGDAIKGLFDDLFGAISAGIGQAIGGFGSFFGTIAQAIGGGASSFFGWIGKGLSWLGGLIPGFQAGGVVLGPTLAMLGEGGPEMVVPLDRARDSIAKTGRFAGGRGGPTLVMNIQTPDLPSFKAGQSQLAAQWTAFMSRGRRNM